MKKVNKVAPGMYIVLLKGEVNKWWDGKAFAAEIKEKALPLNPAGVHEVVKAFKSGEYELHAHVGLGTSGTSAPASAEVGLQLTHSKELKKLGLKIIEGTVAVGRMYLDLCLYIRKNMVAPKLVSFELSELGFKRDIVSKINKVANASDETFNKFAAQTIGFNKVLELARGEVPGSLAREMGEKVVDIQAEVKKLADEEGGTGRPTSGTTATPEEQKAKDNEALEKAAAQVLSRAAKLQLRRTKVINGGNGYLLTISRDKNFKPAKPETTAEDSE